MAEVLLNHHAQGLTDGVLALASTLRRAGHTVHTPDLFNENTFDTIDAGMAFIKQQGMEALADQAMSMADSLPQDLIYMGISFGVVPAQKLAQTRSGARGALLISACIPQEYVGPWPDGLPAQIHGMDADPYFVDDGDLEAARELADQHPSVEVFLYPGKDHYFMDSSLASYDAKATEALTVRMLEFLATR